MTCCLTLLRYVTILPWHNPELPDPAGPLLASIPSMVIEEETIAITSVCQDKAEKTNTKRGPYIRLSDEMRVKIGKYASEKEW